MVQICVYSCDGCAYSSSLLEWQTATFLLLHHQAHESTHLDVDPLKARVVGIEERPWSSHTILEWTTSCRLNPAFGPKSHPRSFSLHFSHRIELPQFDSIVDWGEFLPFQRFTCNSCCHVFWEPISAHGPSLSQIPYSFPLHNPQQTIKWTTNTFHGLNFFLHVHDPSIKESHYGGRIHIKMQISSH